MPYARLITAACAVIVGVFAAVEMFPEPDPSIRFWCSNAPARQITETRTRPIPCGDTTAVTFGYLR